jgi:hypothetical protein
VREGEEEEEEEGPVANESRAIVRRGGPFEENPSEIFAIDDWWGGSLWTAWESGLGVGRVRPVPLALWIDSSNPEPIEEAWEEIGDGGRHEEGIDGLALLESLLHQNQRDVQARISVPISCSSTSSTFATTSSRCTTFCTI